MYSHKIVAKIEGKAILGEWLDDVHIAAYVLDPKYWDDAHYTIDNGQVMSAFKRTIKKVFHFMQPEPQEGWVIVIMNQLQTYKDKVGEFAELHVQRAAKTMEPTTFFRNFGSTVVDLTTMALKIFGIALSNEAAEINWKHYKDHSLKARYISS